MDNITSPLRLRLIHDALVSNWQNLNQLSGEAHAGAAVKANGYGVGAAQVVQRLLAAGCNQFYVASWAEAQEIETLTGNHAQVSVLNGVREEDMAFAIQSAAKPVLNSMKQVTRWANTGKPCDLMINTGMNRLGVEISELGNRVFSDLDIDISMSHLASADEDVAQNADQLNAYRSALEKLEYKRTSLSNSAGIMLGADYHFECTRPGLSLYGGIPRAELAPHIQQVVFPEAQILQVRNLHSGDKLGYNATFIADGDMDVAIISMGYADGYLRGFSGKGAFAHNMNKLPVLGRVSMDLVAIDISNAPDLSEGSWVQCEYSLPWASEKSGLSQYELLTGLGARYDRVWE